jgi:hypothetical protein
MGRRLKGARKKNIWDLRETVRALDEVLRDEEDPGQRNPERSFLHFVRALCRNLDANMAAILAFDRLLRLMREKAEPIRRYARAVNEAYAAYLPLAPGMDAMLSGGQSEPMWRLWFFACEMPKRFRAAMVDMERLLYAADAFMPAPFVVPGFQLATARAAVVLGLRSWNYDLDWMARLLDPLGHRQNAQAARDRVRKEIRRLDAAITRGKRESTPAETASLVSPVPAGNERVFPLPGPPGRKSS